MILKINYSKENFKSFKVDIDSYEENLCRHMKMYNITVENALKDKNLSSKEINRLIESLQKNINKAKVFKSLSDKIFNNKEIEISEDEIKSLIDVLHSNIIWSEGRLEDFKNKIFPWNDEDYDKLIKYENKGQKRRKDLYKKITGKKYDLTYDSIIDF